MTALTYVRPLCDHPSMRVITIMPDFGWGPYAWLKEADDGTTLVGGNIASETCGFKLSEFRVSEALEWRFAEWIREFNNQSHEFGFDWPAFHSTGVELARRLKIEIGDQARVIYYKASEDPASIRTERTEILADGTLLPITVRLWSP